MFQFATHIPYTVHHYSIKATMYKEKGLGPFALWVYYPFGLIRYYVV